jgi:hypothetical protein
VTSPRALYVYAVVQQGGRLARVLGIGDEPVEVIVGAGLGLVASEVDLTLLSEVNEVGDATRLGELALRHDSVVREAHAVASSVLPFRLGTVVPNREAAHRLLTDRAAVLEPALRHVERCREWGVTVHPSDEAAPVSRKAALAAPAGVGAAYLARRRQELAAIEELRRCRAMAGAEVAAELRANGVEAKSGADGNALLCESYLVRRECEPAFLDAIDRCGDRLDECGLRLHLSGPWPPYSFVPSRALEMGRE